MILQEVKACTKCKIVKPYNKFSPAKKHSTGHTSRCKDCKNVDLALYYRSEEGNKERKVAFKKYGTSVAGKNSFFKRRKKYETTPKGKLAKKKWDKKYTTTPKGRIIANIAKAKYRSNKIYAIPKGLKESDFELIRMYYQLANYMTEVTGIPHEVDHIIPLQGKNICGLHVPWNLRVITKSENCTKGNRICL